MGNFLGLGTTTKQRKQQQQQQLTQNARLETVADETNAPSWINGTHFKFAWDLLASSRGSDTPARVVPGGDGCHGDDGHNPTGLTSAAAAAAEGAHLDWAASGQCGGHSRVATTCGMWCLPQWSQAEPLKLLQLQLHPSGQSDAHCQSQPERRPT